MVSKDHVAGMVGDAVIGVSCAVVKEMVDAGGGGYCDSGLLGSDFTEGVQ